MKSKLSLTTQNRLILLGLISSTLLIILIAVLASVNIQNKLNEGYQNFGKIISKTLAVESADLIKDIPEFAKYDKLKAHSQSILNSTDDIAFIEFMDNYGNVIYSSKEDYARQSESSKIAVSSPMVVKKQGKSYPIGSVMVGLSGNIIHVLGVEFYRFFSKDFNLISSALIFLCATTIIFITGLKNKMVSLIVLLIIFIATSGIIYKGFKEYTIKEKNNSQLIEALKIYSSKNSKVIINFDISQEYFTYAESAIPVRDDSNETSIAFFNKFFPLINEFYKYQLYFPHIKVNRIDSQLKDKPASDLILSSENNLFEIYPGAKIVAIDGVENPKMVNMERFYNLKLWLLPGKNYNYFNAN